MVKCKYYACHALSGISQYNSLRSFGIRQTVNCSQSYQLYNYTVLYTSYVLYLCACSVPQSQQQTSRVDLGQAGRRGRTSQAGLGHLYPGDEVLVGGVQHSWHRDDCHQSRTVCGTYKLVVSLSHSKLNIVVDSLRDFN